MTVRFFVAASYIDKRPVMEEKFPHLTEEEADRVWTNAFIAIRRKEKRKRRRRYIMYTGIAALLILGGGLLGYNTLLKPNVYFADSENLRILLADSSEVILQKGAKLTVEKSFPEDTREVTLDGDAIFKVTKSKQHPFVVHAGNYQTKVLGTVFKVIQKGRTFNVDLYEGKVQVYRNEKPKDIFILRPRESFSNMGSAKVASVVPTRNTASERRLAAATLSFSDMPLSEAVGIIEKTYGIKVIFPEDRADTLISITKEHATGNDLLKLISLQLNLNLYKKDEFTFKLEN